MDLTFGPEYDTFRSEVVTFLANNADKAPLIRIVGQKGNDFAAERVVLGAKC